MNSLIGSVTVKTAIATAVALAVTGSGSEARADASCNVLIAQLRAVQGNSRYVAAHHITHFQIPATSGAPDWWVGAAVGFLRSVNGHMVGDGDRLFSNRVLNLQPFDVNRPTPIHYDIDPAGKVTFDGVWGPLDPKCFANKFMILVGSTAIEAFVFDLDPIIGLQPEPHAS